MYLLVHHVAIRPTQKKCDIPDPRESSAVLNLVDRSVEAWLQICQRGPIHKHFLRVDG